MANYQDEPRKQMESLAQKAAKRDTHRHLDRLWKTAEERRSTYAWLAKEMGIEDKECHIEFFSIQQCKEVIRLVRERENRDGM